MKTFLLNTRRRELEHGTSRAWLFLVFLSAVGQIMAQPTVTIASPTNNAILYVASTVGFSVDASNNDDTVANVEFHPDIPLVGAVTNSPYQLSLAFSPPAPQVRTEAETKPALSYSPRLELGAPKPNSVQSEQFAGIEYSGILVQVARANPLQIINTFAPAKYGDGEANILRDPLTRKVEGWRLWQISF